MIQAAVIFLLYFPARVNNDFRKSPTTQTNAAISFINVCFFFFQTQFTLKKSENQKYCEGSPTFLRSFENNIMMNRRPMTICVQTIRQHYVTLVLPDK